MLTYFGEEFMIEDLIQGQSVAGVFLQDTRDEFLCRRGDGGGNSVPNFLYTLVRLFQVQCLKGRVATHQSIPMKKKPQLLSVRLKKNVCSKQRKMDIKPNLHDASEGPDVRLCAVTLSVEDLGGQVVGSSTDSSEKTGACLSTE